MQKILVRIIRDGKEAVEVRFNKDGKQKKEKLRCFDIDFSHLTESIQALVKAAGGTLESITHIGLGYEVGKYFHAEVISRYGKEDYVKIISEWEKKKN